MRATSSRPVRRTLVAMAAAALPLALVAVSAPAQSAPTGAAPTADAPERPTRVVQVVLDALRPELIEAFDMENVQALMAGGAAYPNAYLGHMAAETVVSHNVMTSGMLPKHMGWSDEWFRDVDGVIGPPNEHYVTGSMGQTQFDALIDDKGYPKLADYLNDTYPDKVVATIGEKAYAVHTYGGPGSEIRITMSSRNFDCDGGGLNWRGPTGTNVPAYIDEPECGRFYVDSDKTMSYGTASTSPAWMYPLDGNRDVPGNDPAHRGGDRWVTDAAFKVMDHEDWSGLLLTYGGIDKAGHMWGGLDDVRPYPPGADGETHLAHIARVADRQIGRLVERLEADGLMDETLIVLTTDHGQLTSENFYGIDEAGRGYFNWYYGSDSDETYLSPSPEIQKLIDKTGGNIEMSMQDSAVRAWLLDRTRQDKKQGARAMASLGGVQASYWREGRHYVLRWRAARSEFTASEWAWFRQHAQEIVDTEAHGYGPEVIGLLGDNTSYGVAGDHGGAQESVQRIPIVFYGAGVTPGSTVPEPVRSVDILPTVLREMQIPVTHWMDGRRFPVP